MKIWKYYSMLDYSSIIRLELIALGELTKVSQETCSLEIQQTIVQEEDLARD